MLNFDVENLLDRILNVKFNRENQHLKNAKTLFSGRPRSEALTTLMIEGSSSPSSIKCVYCNRVFPREKSLQAHLRTHTGMYIMYLCISLFCTWPFKLRHVVFVV